MDFNKESTFEEYYEVDEELHNLENEKRQALSQETKEEVEKVFLETEEKNAQKIEELRARRNTYKKGMEQIWVEYYKELVTVNAGFAFGDTLDVPTKEILFTKQRIDHKKFYQWVSQILPHEKTKIDFLIYEVMMQQVQNVIYDFDVENYDDDFLDYRDTCNKIMQKIESWNIEDSWLKRRISHMRTITDLQQKEKLVTFINRYKSGLVAMDSHNTIENPQDIRRTSLIRRMGVPEDGRMLLELTHTIYNAVADPDQREAMFQKIITLYEEIYDDLGDHFGDTAVIKILRELWRNTDTDFPLKKTDEQKEGYKILYDQVRKHFQIDDESRIHPQKDKYSDI